MSTMNRTSTIVAATTATVLTGLLAYAVYFDYKRRNDAEFRRKLRSQKKKVEKHAAEAKASSETFELNDDNGELQAIVLRVRAESQPENPAEREKLFQDLLQKGERLLMLGPSAFLEAAVCFYRALRLYPSPVELMMIYQQSVPEQCLKIVMEMYNLDVIKRIEDYYDEFPPKSMNVAIEQVETGDSAQKRPPKQVLVASKDFKAGEEIYKELPVVAALDVDVQGKGTHCSFCLRQVLPGMAIRQDKDPLNSVYCSKKCQLQSRIQSDNFLFGFGPPLPVELTDESMPPDFKEIRLQAQINLVRYIKDTKKTATLLVARFVALQVAIETLKLMPPNHPQRQLMPEGSIGAEHTFYDHMERLRYLELKTPEGEWKMLHSLLAITLPGLEQSHTEDRHAIFKGKMAYNCIGICYGGGRDNKPVPTDRPEDIERTRTPYGTQKQIGSGVYFVSSYIRHSCSPSVRPSFKDGTSELHLVATRDIKKGEQLTMAYVDVSQHKNETALQARHRRRYELARGWRFACECEKCIAEQKSGKEDVEEGISKLTQDAKFEPAVIRHLNGEANPNLNGNVD